jgi:hypothetical protein
MKNGRYSEIVLICVLKKEEIKIGFFLHSGTTIFGGDR